MLVDRLILIGKSKRALNTRALSFRKFYNIYSDNNLKEVFIMWDLEDIWLAIMDYWWLVMIIGAIALAPLRLSGLWIGLIAIGKLIQKSIDRHNNY